MLVITGVLEKIEMPSREKGKKFKNGNTGRQVCLLNIRYLIMPDPIRFALSFAIDRYIEIRKVSE